jgi:RimJ/RimL family protein N-acetyltransferase
MYYGELVILRALETDDLDIILEHFNSLELRQFLATAWPMSRNAERKWLERATVMHPWKDGEMILAITDKKTNEFLGTVSLFDISKQHQKAEFGIAIHNPDNLGRGYGTDTTRVMLWVAFHVLGLNTVYLLTLESNTRAQRVYEKTGFKHAGILRQGGYVLGKFHDFKIMDITKDEFFEIYPPGTRVSQP